LKAAIAKAIRRIEDILSSAPDKYVKDFRRDAIAMVRKMKFGETYHIFGGKCPVLADDAEGEEDLSLANLNTVALNSKNASVRSFAAMTKGIDMSKAMFFNLRDKCIPQSRKLRTCKECTMNEADRLTDVLNVIGEHGEYVRCNLILCNVGGTDTNMLYRKRKDGTDRLTFNLFEKVLWSGTHMSSCTRFRGCSFPSPKHQKYAVYLTLKAICEVLGLEKNHQDMINERTFYMVVPLSELDGDEPQFGHGERQRKTCQHKEGCKNIAQVNGLCRRHGVDANTKKAVLIRLFLQTVSAGATVIDANTKKAVITRLYQTVSAGATVDEMISFVFVISAVC
jgi:hypothetical protein